MDISEILSLFDWNNPFIQKLAFSAIVIFLAYLLAFGIVRFINIKIENLKKRHRTRRYIYYVTTGLALIVLALIWLEQTANFVTYLGFISAGVALALHEVIINIAGWVLVLIRRPFDLGDRIEWGDVCGDVIDVRVFYTTLLEVGNWVESDQSTGRLVHIPNSTIFKRPAYNYTDGFPYIWNEMHFLVTFESDWKKAKQIVLNMALKECESIQEKARQEIKKMARRYMIRYSKLSPITYTDIKDSGVEITLRYLTSVRRRRVIQNQLNEGILDRFAEERDIDFAYPTWRVYKQPE
ncbi:mechanosensitive ion channel family protein [Fuchsiella alkaliacetigena]|uniref:mechanosensitive ion channel family protein n=1 Tax=Fuchsiella alkaliacetigena TaxID=957042 RepID=UPI00200A055A|nr:mechanosensitive ion channel domain-containing protein [Fuchsiella alkaliacetigena]MCK8823653.1 mechanosensitive ion channel family protein [Fuchsiella alkaliacetigena]